MYEELEIGIIALMVISFLVGIYIGRRSRDKEVDKVRGELNRHIWNSYIRHD